MNAARRAHGRDEARIHAWLCEYDQELLSDLARDEAREARDPDPEDPQLVEPRPLH